MECYCSLRNVQDLLADGESSRMNEDLGNLSKDQLFHLVHLWNTSQLPRETKLEFINFGKKVIPGIFLGYALIAGENLERRHSDC